ncbi:hypothetical protein D9757_003779 [Collybiopsis confluens]|uniref:Major facilitator superfamily (MFS) profile domain-containing protein n=1 Tax=Collybiopsis confluens TaxID=2823264 RepID=A0A8H5MD50_9AGAR|nr:hypothetical protein D9757_003779 [Collybiopsis confluens]
MSESPRPSLQKEQASEHHLENGSNDYDFGGESQLPPPPTLSAQEEARLWRKIDMRLMPILCIMYLMSFMDRGNIGNAKLQGLETQLKLHGNQYNIALTMYFIPYCIFECPANLVLKKFRPSLWLPAITIVWGIVMTLMGLVKTYPQLVGVRVCLGVAEAGLFPGVSYYLSLWYPRNVLQTRIGLFFGAATVAGAFSGLFAFAISFMSGTRGLLGWSWIFERPIIEGIITVGVGLVALLILVDFPATAKFLTPEERAFVVWKKSNTFQSHVASLLTLERTEYDNSSVGEEENFKMKHIYQAFADWQVWVHILIYMSSIGPRAVWHHAIPTVSTKLRLRYHYGCNDGSGLVRTIISEYVFIQSVSILGANVLSSFGQFSTAVSQLLTVPPYIFATIVLGFFAYYSDKIMMRAPFVYASNIMCLIGFALNIADIPSGWHYAGTFLIVAGAYAGFPGVVAWLSNNLSGQYKRGVGMALQIGIGNFSGAIAANIFRPQDKPRFVLGHGLEIMFVSFGLILVPVTVYTYTRINKKKDEFMARVAEGLEKMPSPDEIRALGDRSPDFKYIL